MFSKKGWRIFQKWRIWSKKASLSQAFRIDLTRAWALWKTSWRSSNWRRPV